MRVQPDPALVAQSFERVDRYLAGQDTVVSLLEQIANQSGDGLQTLGIAENEVNGGIEADFPVEGARRWIVPRLATGGTFAVPEGLVSLLPANNRRLGGKIVNIGEADVTLTLASPQDAAAQQGLAQIRLKKEGGEWDFLLGSLLWCGSVCARGVAASSVTIAEV